MEALVAAISIATYAVLVETIPPPACFANFRWDDCGMQPKPVMYYWKPGSRCEVGIWRGCRPNINMFKDEYECVSTCIFSVRAKPPDWHRIKEYEEATTPLEVNTEQTTDLTADVNTTDIVGNTTNEGGGDEVVTDGENLPGGATDMPATEDTTEGR